VRPYSASNRFVAGATTRRIEGHGASHGVEGIVAMRRGDFDVRPLQAYI
jgi:hypothetical protein